MTPEQFMENFGAIAESEKGIQELRYLVLSLAVRGGLSERNPDDGAVDDLILEVSIQKGRSADKARSSAYPVRFDLPRGWVWVTVEQVAEYVQRGKGPKYAESSAVPVISQKCIQWSGFELSRARWVEEASLSKYKKNRFLQPGDLLWNSTGTGTVGRVNILPDFSEQYCRIVADSHVTVVRLAKASPEFIWCWLASSEVQDTIEDVATGTTKQKELGTGTIKGYPVPIPPLAEQKRIVAKVDELMAMLDDLEQRQEKKRAVAIHVSKASLDSLVNAEDPDQLARAWERVSKNFGVAAGADGATERLRAGILGLAASGQFGGKGAKKVKIGAVIQFRQDLVRPVDGVDEDLVFVGPQHIVKNTGARNGCVRQHSSKLKGRKFRFSPGEIVYTYLRPYLNKVWIATLEGVCSVDQYVLRVNECVAEPRYIQMMMLGPQFVAETAKLTHSLQLPRLRSKLLAGIELPLPPLEEQRSIVTIVERLIETLDGVRVAQEELLSTTKRLAAAVTPVPH